MHIEPLKLRLKIPTPGASHRRSWVILNPLIPLATEQIKLAWGFKKDLETLCRRLTIIQALLSDAENWRLTSTIMCEWLKKLKLVTCDVENVLDEFAYETLRRKLEVQNQMRNKFLNAASTSVEPRYLNFRPTHPFVDDSQVVGRDGDVSTMIYMLIGSYESGDDLSIIAIVRMGGIGKTTLAQLVYNNKTVVKHFGDQRMWICVSDDFIVPKLLNQMVQSLTGDKFDTE
ncbi:disease resistance protein RGA2-like [Camellia sinensis]|uniref:disease resistance protein RGA2-like n=1 Tax=Camellia sinensis TaxID=4442 RepID=UPI0010367BE1|nr:disease resistance protein RGA2-like [Camellia sinensis]